MDDTAPPARDWSLLPLDVLSSIFIRLGAVDVLTGAGLVCRSWLQAAKLPDVWRVVEIDDHGILHPRNLVAQHTMAKAAVERSDGQLRVFAGKHFVTDDLIKYIVERSPSLTTLRLVSYSHVFSQQVASAIKESPLLELRSLELGDIDITVGELTAVLEYCPALEVLRLHNCLDIDDTHTLQAKFPRIKNLTLEWDNAYWSRFYTDTSSYSDSAPDSEDERTDGSM
ncbi:F-box protein SKIP19-like [Aegilops tauschii subsp. strangulata]